MICREDGPSEGEFQKFGQSSGEGNETSTSTLDKAVDASEISDRHGHL